MIINNTKEFKEVCKTILLAIDTTTEPTRLNEALELTCDENNLILSVTNREYFVKIKLALVGEVGFRATVNALLFLKLIFQLTTDTLELTVEDSALVIRADGTYKLPLIYKGEELLELPQIELNNITTTMDIDSSILSSILQYNTRELQNSASKITYNPAQKLYYVDNNGAITFTTGACVNNFTLEKPIKLFLSPKIVKLFKLFSEDTSVAFEMAQDVDVNNNIETKVRFYTDTIDIVSTIHDAKLLTKLLESTPVTAIRNMSTKQYDYSVLLERDHLIRALSRLLLFRDNLSIVAGFTFTKDHCVIEYSNNVEIVKYSDAHTEDLNYQLHMNIEMLKNILDGSTEDYITFNFGDHKAVVIVRQNILNIIPEWTIS